MKNFNKRSKALVLSALLILGFSFAVVPYGPEYPDPLPMSTQTEIGIDQIESN